MRRVECHIYRYKRFLWVLATAVCLMQALPLHLHLHHASPVDQGTGMHEMDVYIANSSADEGHHGDAHVIELDANSILKSLDSDVFVPMLFLFLLALVFIPVLQHREYCHAPAGASPRQRYLEFAPLRAPPHT